MTGRDELHEADEALREAFQALGETSRDAVSAEDRERIWQAVSGDLSATARRELIERTASDPALAEAWRAADELWRAAPQSIPAATRVARSWPLPWLAAAAVLVIGIAAGLVVQRSSLSRDTFRDSNHYVIEPLVPADATLPRDTFRLRWTPGPQDSRYQVRVTTEDLRLLTTASDLTVPELVVDRSLLSGVASGARVLWQVDVTLPGREGIVSSQTFIVRVQ